MGSEELVEQIRKKFERLSGVLDERGRRRWASVEAETLGYGGQRIVAKATGLSRTTLHREVSEQALGLTEIHLGRIRKAGGGRKKLTAQHPELLLALESLVEPTRRGDPASALRWTCRSTRQLAAALGSQGYRMGHQTVASWLDELGYSLQGNQKTKEGSGHPDRDAQFQYLHGRVRDFQDRGQPVVSVDTKEKGTRRRLQEWRPQGDPEPVRVYDFVNKVLEKANPYGVYDPTAYVGWVSVGVDHDTAEFAVETLRRWWEKMGRLRFPSPKNC
jgi:hypothetical protein